MKTHDARTISTTATQVPPTNPTMTMSRTDSSSEAVPGSDTTLVLDMVVSESVSVAALDTVLFDRATQSSLVALAQRVAVTLWPPSVEMTVVGEADVLVRGGVVLVTANKKDNYYDT